MIKKPFSFKTLANYSLNRGFIYLLCLQIEFKQCKYLFYLNKIRKVEFPGQQKFKQKIY